MVLDDELELRNSYLLRFSQLCNNIMLEMHDWLDWKIYSLDRGSVEHDREIGQLMLDTFVLVSLRWYDVEARSSKTQFYELFSGNMGFKVIYRIKTKIGKCVVVLTFFSCLLISLYFTPLPCK